MSTATIGDLPRAGEQEGQRADQDEEAAGQVAHGLHHELLERGDVARHPGEHVPGAALVVEGERQPLQLVVQRLPGVVAEDAAVAGEVDLGHRVGEAVEGGEQDQADREHGHGLVPRVRQERDVDAEPGPVPAQEVDEEGDRVGGEYRGDRLEHQHGQGKEVEPLPS